MFKEKSTCRLTNNKSTQSRYSIYKKSRLLCLCSLDVPNWSIHWTRESSSLQGSRSCIHDKRIAPISLRICCLPKCLCKCSKYNLHQICSHSCGYPTPAATYCRNQTRRKNSEDTMLLLCFVFFCILLRCFLLRNLPLFPRFTFSFFCFFFKSIFFWSVC